MAGEGSLRGLAETTAWLEEQIRSLRDAHETLAVQLDHLRKQLANLAEELEDTQQNVREVEPRFVPLRGVPEKIVELEREAEELRQGLVATQQQFEHTARLLRAEAEYDRQERAELYRRVNELTAALDRVAADASQAQTQVAEYGRLLQTLLERQRVVEEKTEQFGLRLERAIEVNRDLEQRVRSVLEEEQQERFTYVFEQLRIVGEMVKRNEESITGIASRQGLEEEVLDELAAWREEHRRIEARLASLEEHTDRILGELDKLRADLTLLEGRHAGLGERVAGVRRDIAEILDHVRAEFQRYNQLVEKQRRAQISVLEQELRELKFHGLRPPEEP